MKSNAKSLCENLQHEILSWLPSKSLLRFTSVCKSWHSAIHHSFFIKKHTTNLSRTENNNRTILVMPRDNPSTTCNFYSGKTCEIRSTLALPFTPMQFSFIRVVGSCNGLICLADQVSYCHFRLYIWNPSIRTLKLLPPCSIRFSSVKFSTFGIGFHRLSNDYRVVRITNYHGNLTEVEVYSLSTDSWRMVDLGDRLLPVRETENNSVSVNGYIYWLATKRRILSYNMNNDSFEEIVHPQGSGFYLASSHIAVLRGQLCVLNAPYFGFSINRKVQEHHIWMMRENGVSKSWTEICRIRQGERFFGTFGLTVKGELLHFTEVEDKNLCLYDHENLQYYDLCKGSIVLAITYTESLVLLDTQRDQKLNKKRKFSSL